MDKMKQHFLYVVVGVLLALTGCTSQVDTPQSRTIVDMAGNEVELPQTIERIASIYPSTTDMLVALGQGDAIVATYRTTLDNPWVEHILPQSAQWEGVSYDTSVETFLAMDVDLVFMPDEESAAVLRQAGIPTVVIRQYTKDEAFDDEYYQCAQLIGEIFGGETQEKAQAWEEEVRETIAEIQTVLEGQEAQQSVYYVNGEKQKGLWYSDGGNSTISTTLELLGQQLATDVYLVETVHGASTEEMISLNPDVIFIGGVYQQSLVEELYDDVIWNQLPCVLENRVYTIPVGVVSMENLSAETAVMLKYAANLFYPELFSYDVTTDLQTCFAQYFDYTLSEQEAAWMLEGRSFDGQVLIE